MKGRKYAPGGGIFGKGGAQTFLHKGSNGRWRDVLSEPELLLYDQACQRALTPDCREWLENGKNNVIFFVAMISLFKLKSSLISLNYSLLSASIGFSRAA